MAQTAASVGRGALTLRSPRDHGIAWHRDVPREWTERLHTVVLPGDGPSWLMLRWEPGEAWWPVERWALWQVRSRETTAQVYPDVLKELEGPNPRRRGHACVRGWCACEKPANRWRWMPNEGDPPTLIDYWQWQLYRDTGLYGTRWWCVQGTEGGHRWGLSQIEQELRALRGEPKEVPWAGALPYAPFDERTVNAIMAEDRRRRGLVLAQDHRMAKAQLARQQSALQAAKASAARSYVAQREATIAASAAPFLHALDREVGPAPEVVTTRDERVAARAAYEADGEALVSSLT